MRQSLLEGGIPFEVKLEKPNKETVAAMLEAERIAKDPSVKGYKRLIKRGLKNLIAGTGRGAAVGG